VPKVRGPLFSQDARGRLGRGIIFRRGGVALRWFKPRDPQTAAQLAQREAFKEFSMSGLTQEQADLLYAAIAHLHTGVYAPFLHDHDHGDLEGLGDDDHLQYLTGARANALYSLLSHLHTGIYSPVSHDHAGVYSSTSHNHDAAYAPISAAFAPGMMLNYGGSFAPAGWLLCNGAAVSRSTYAALFAVIGSSFGAGDGSTTFNVPDLRRRVAVGAGGSGSATLGNVVGNSGGEEAHTLTASEMPAHTHGTVTGAAAGMQTGTSNYRMNSLSGSVTGSTGGDAAHNNMPPSLVVNVIIKI